jgi:hypothetical protein
MKLQQVTNKEVNLRVNNGNLITGILKDMNNGIYCVDGVYFHNSDVTSILGFVGEIYLHVYTNRVGVR